MTAALSLAPDAPPPDPVAVEAATREALCRRIHLALTVRAPSWHQILFGLSRLDFRPPRAPDSVVEEIARKYTPDNVPNPQSAADVRAGAIVDQLSKEKPEGSQPRSMTARPKLPPPRSANDAWYRKVFLLAAGPEALRLLAGAGYLTSQDVATIGQFYPKGLDKERMEAVQAAMSVTAASKRTGHDADLPPWLNDQLFTLMVEKRPTQFYGSLFTDAKQPKQGAPSIASAPRTRIVDQLAPSTTPGERE